MIKDKILIILLIITGAVYVLFSEIDTYIVKNVLIKGTAFSIPLIILTILAIKIESKTFKNIIIFTLLLLSTLIIRYLIATKDYFNQGVIMLIIFEVASACLVYLLIKKYKSKSPFQK